MIRYAQGIGFSIQEKVKRCRRQYNSPKSVTLSENFLKECQNALSMSFDQEA
jgi:hypothetical protein